MVRDFINVTSKCDFDIDISNNTRYIVDAKSILGVLGLDLTRPLTLSYSGFNAALESYIKAHALAC